MDTVSNLNILVSGALIMGYAIAGIFFFKFWRESRDRLFAIFATAFWVLALQRIVLAVTTQTVEDVTHVYAIRLVAYVLIVVGIIVKNRQSG